MSYKGVGSWLISENGKKFSCCVATIAGMSAFCVQYLPHTFFLGYHKDFVHYYRNGISVPLQKNLSDRFKKAMDLAEISDKTKKFYSAFNVVGFDMFSAGTCHSKYGCIVGLPVNFTYDDVDTIQKSQIKIMAESVVWDTKEAKDFLSSLVLSENAQIYAMAREMRMMETMKLYIDSTCSTLSVYFTYAISQFLNVRLNLYVKPVGVRVTMYALLGTFWLTNYFFLKDCVQLKYERQVDEELKHLNPIFTEGAIEFYGKLLQRNKALRKLMGPEGEQMFSVHGNENYMLRQKHLPLVQRMAYFENKLDPKDSPIKQYV